MPRSSASAAPTGADAASAAFGRSDAALYALLVFVWSTSWIAMHHQLGVVAPAVSLVWRFGLASALCFAIALMARAALRFPARAHAKFAAAGVLMYSSNFLLFYIAGAHIPSGLLAVVFALASPMNLALGAAFFGRPIDRNVAVGAVLGVAGVGLLYAPQIAGSGFDAAAVGGLALCVAGTLCFSLGNMVSGLIQQDNVPDVAAAAWGTLYGTVFLAGVALLNGATFAIEWTPLYLGSLLWLAALSSVAAFLAYLALIKRIGPARAGFATVLFPVLALAISSVVEDYRWTAWSFVGLALVAAGNVIVLGLAGRKA